ncbi:MAG: hypothetical protein KAR42_03100 [candidate division Zixibacteria bacterium]|nr:hypothetical protein [candidate division Zixibacteria bacterium]
MKTLFTLCITIFLIGCAPDNSENNNQLPQPGSTNAISTSDASGNSSESITGKMADADIIPLNLGNLWTYQMFQIDTTNGKMNPTQKITYAIHRDTVMDNEVWYLIEGMGPNGTWGINRDDGFWIIGPTGQPILLAKFPGQIGDEYSKITGAAIIINRIESTGESVTVPSGSYFCYKYAQEFGGKSRTSYAYYSPGVGMVRLEVMNESLSKAVMIGELIDISVK